MSKIKGMMKAAVALVLAGSMMIGNSVNAFADDQNAYYDGNTPSNIRNVVVGADGVEIHSSIRTTFLTPEIGTLCPITPYMDFDRETGKDKSTYADARTEMYMLPAETSTLRMDTLTKLEKEMKLTRLGYTSMYLFLYEDQYYIPIPTTQKLMQFRIGIDRSIVNKDKEYILIEMKYENNEVNYYMDIDDDNYTVTFATNDFTGYNMYVLECAPRGSFATLEAEINQGLKKGVTKQTVINEAVADLLKAQQQ